MSQDYYNKFYNTFKVLQEEYEKKQLYLLKLEREQLTNLNLERTNLNLQENLQRINKRMENTGETYRNVMKKMEEMDHSTNFLLDILTEKLALYQASKESHLSLYNYPNRDLHKASNQELFNNTSDQELFNNTSDQELLNNTSNQELLNNTSNQELLNNTSNQELHRTKSSVNMQAKKYTLSQPLQNLNSVSTQTSVATQTENIYCGHCKAEGSFFNLVQNVRDNSQNLQFASSSLSRISLSSESQVILPDSLPEKSMSSHVSSSIASLHPVAEVDANKSFQPKNPKIIQQADSKNQDSELHITSQENLVPTSFENSLSLNKNEILTAENEHSNAAKDKELANINSDISLTERTEKSDEESMNHEFDFLETVTSNAGVKDKNKETNISLVKNSSIKTCPSNEQQNQSKLKQKEANESVLLENPVTDVISANKSDVSLGIIEPESPHPHSSNVSALSDSESLSGKETPLKASAAYQALLGSTTVVEKRREQIDSDSDLDSLNGVESLVLPKSSVQQNKEEKSLPLQTETNSSKKPSKQTSVSKPQSKLSKKTRKVLGLDTSSGSEVELTVKPPEKDGEDSDEFDFYD